MSGIVYLIGAGPGDPELLTIKAARILRSADVVLHDELVALGVLEIANPQALVQNVGKRAAGKHFPQALIAAAMIAHARQGKTVVRLKGGDPLIFARAAEEISALQEAGIEFEIVPGITTAFGAAASAGFPLTDRDHAPAVLFVSGHSCVTNQPVDWAAAATVGATLVIYMPGDHRRLAASLLAGGFDCDTPCAFISHVSLPDERTHRCVLHELLHAAAVEKPAVLIVGEVARQREIARSIGELRPPASEIDLVTGFQAAGEGDHDNRG